MPERDIDPKEFIDKLNNECHGDTEGGHGYADSILCELLELLGYEDVVEAYNKVEKWYA